MRGKSELIAEVTGENSTRGYVGWMALCSLCALVFVRTGRARVFERIYFMCQYVNALNCLLTLAGDTCVCVCAC